VNPECWTFGEVTLPADAQLSFAGGLDGTLDFLTCQALRETFALQTWPLSRFAGYLQDSLAYFPQDFSRPAFLDNHDMNRFLFTAGNQVERLKLALTMLYLLPGQPLVYFGTETGLSQPRSIHDPDSIGFDQARLPMNWQEAEAYADLAGLMRKMAAFRERFPQLAEADWQLLLVDDQKEVALWRVNMPHDQFFVALNRAEVAQQIPLTSAQLAKNALMLIDEGEKVIPSGTSVLELQSGDVRVFKLAA